MIGHLVRRHHAQLLVTRYKRKRMKRPTRMTVVDGLERLFDAQRRRIREKQGLDVTLTAPELYSCPIWKHKRYHPDDFDIERRR